MKLRLFAISGIFLLAACDKKSSATGQDAPSSSGKKHSSSALGERSSEEEPAAPGKAKSSERPKDQVKKPPLAAAAQGQPGKVISPFTGKPVDVSGKKAGDLVGDPSDESKQFVVPEDVETDTKTVQVARGVPGKPGFVFSPHSNQIIDVNGMKPGTLVADPTFPASEKKHFRIPSPAEEVPAEPDAAPALPGNTPPMPDR